MLSFHYSIAILHFFYLVSGMGVLWPAQVRCVHLALLAITLVPLFVCLSYFNANQLNTTAAPLRNFDSRIYQTNVSIVEKSTSARHVSETSEGPPQPVPSHPSANLSNNNNSGNTIYIILLGGRYCIIDYDLSSFRQQTDCTLE